jgi:hypothetical protein
MQYNSMCGTPAEFEQRSIRFAVISAHTPDAGWNVARIVVRGGPSLRDGFELSGCDPETSAEQDP